ncbi:bifunctional diguanylate cyclase/phosphodiesterase [Telluria mixta]|uniref:Bifunctional diguanylate cyclase/phosphodiesterase n=1 Tax=Telluria mixta TaxID=34071 RepID=A0ABT2C3K0_9BURK|nr:bifunctional diguanylate cyclase/phosphodiesterase [Telluria mixta]MCS0631959.1 bifunctional diguanylate cyclase/phosphodiesterase [Telluria mixta]WEM95362.1 bifunctional diguanylate cyclase/phosphodiesterase [Telluria mixta]
MSDTNAYEALVQFLYRAPIGLVQASLDGTVDMLNPMSSSLLMPLARDGSLDNLFTVLQDVAPQLRDLTAAFEAPSGVVCEGLRVQLGDAAAPGAPQVLSLSVLKLDGTRLMATVTDATAEVQREQDRLARRLRSQARTDALTRMPNREAVLEQLQQMLGRPPLADGGGFALVFMNCDRFRQVNDALGQATGDRLLVQIGERIRATLRPPSDRIDTHAGAGQMAARVGADEFAVVLDGLRSRADAERVATRLLDALARPHALDGQDVVIRLSMGLVWSGDAGADAGAMLRDASIAMVEAKRAGGARCVAFETAMRERAARRADIESDLRQALVDDQLFVVYQPVVGLRADGATDHAAGVEALVRWRHPVRGVVPPIEFIQVAEESGLIGALGDFVLRRACSDFAAWQRALGERAPRLLAVNLSRAQLAEPGWPAVVRDVLAQNGMRPDQLQLEVTESLAAQDQQVQQRLHELKAVGVTLALDDFGTGYSSLSSLHQLPVDTVKIDRSFVCQADTSHHHRVLIEATVKVAQSLGMSTVAEGIETEAQAAAVRAQACAKGQGYLFSRPLASPDLIEWLSGR